MLSTGSVLATLRAEDEVLHHQSVKINDIVSLEWEMFVDVNKGGVRASCQNDSQTFWGMRSAQFKAWSQEALDSYFSDLTVAQETGHNLLEEKYLHMMAESDPGFYEHHASLVAEPSKETLSIVTSIMEIILTETAPLFMRYPCVASNGRPLYSRENHDGVTSVETYQRGELLTYSERTLGLLYAHIQTLQTQGISYAEEVLTNSVCFYGFESLSEAETKAEIRLTARLNHEMFSSYHSSFHEE
jgi:hypothetical protein